MLIIFETFAPKTFDLSNKIKNNTLQNNSESSAERFWVKDGNDYIFFKKNDLKVFQISGVDLVAYSMSNEADLSLSTINAEISSIVLSNQLGNIYIDKKDNKTKHSIELNKLQLEALEKDIRTLSLIGVFDLLIYSLDNDLNYYKYAFEILFRILKPLTLVGMILLAVPFIFNLQRNISIGKRIFLATSIGVFAHLLSKVLSIISLKFETYALLGPFIPSILMICIGYVLLKYKKIA